MTEPTFPPGAPLTHAAKLVQRGDKLVCETCGKAVMPAPNADISYGRLPERAVRDRGSKP